MGVRVRWCSRGGFRPTTCIGPERCPFLFFLFYNCSRLFYLVYRMTKGRGREEREVGEKGQCRGRGSSSSEEGREEEIQGREGKDVKRARTFNSVDGIETEMVSDSSEEEGVEKKGDVKMIVRFAEGGIGKMNPLKLTKELTGKCGDIMFARVLGDGNLLIDCKK